MSNRVAFYIAMVLALASPADASWTKIAQLPAGPGGCICFQSPTRWYLGTGDPNGFYNCHPAVYYSQDGGHGWLPAVCPSDGGRGAVTSIFFNDSIHGWATVTYSDNTRQPGWRTIDGGATWSVDSSQPQDGTDAYLVRDSVKFLRFPVGSQFARIDSLTLLICGVGKAGPMRSIDAGKTWKQAAHLPAGLDAQETWGIYWSPEFNIVMSAPEGQADSSSVLISTDSGSTWFWGPHWPAADTFAEWTPTGGIAGAGGAVYVQSASVAARDGKYRPGLRYPAHRGLCRSTDGGVSWVNVGGPSHYRDTRFGVYGCHGEHVIAFDDSGGVWRTDDGGDGLLRAQLFESDSLSLTSIEFPPLAPCEWQDTIITFVNTGCDPTILLAVTADSGTTVTTGGTFPLQLESGGEDTIHVRFQSGSPGTHSGTILVFTRDSTTPAYIVHVQGNGTQPTALQLSLDTLPAAAPLGLVDLMVRLTGVAPKSPISGLRFSIAADMNAYSPIAVEGLQGTVTDFTRGNGTASVTQQFVTPIDMLHPITRIALMAMQGTQRVNAVSLIVDSVALDHDATPGCYMTMATSGTTGTIAFCGDSVARIVRITPEAAVRMFPNPAHDALMVCCVNGQVLQDACITMVDVLGREVLRTNTTVGSQPVAVDIASAPKGVYAVFVRAAGFQQQWLESVVR